MVRQQLYSTNQDWEMLWGFTQHYYCNSCWPHLLKTYHYSVECDQETEPGQSEKIGNYQWRMHPPQFIVLLLLMLQYNNKRNQNTLRDNLSRDWTRQKLSVEVFCQIKRISFCNLSFSPSSLSTAFWPTPSSLCRWVPTRNGSCVDSVGQR